MNQNKALWEKGDFTQIAATMRQSGQELVEGLEVVSGMELLDLGCGDGTTALPAAELGANVLGIDIASNLVAAGNARAAAAGLTNLRFQEGDASNLDGIAAERFDLVLSVFGAMFAPRRAVKSQAPRLRRHLERRPRTQLWWMPGQPSSPNLGLQRTQMWLKPMAWLRQFLCPRVPNCGSRLAPLSREETPTGFPGCLPVSVRLKCPESCRMGGHFIASGLVRLERLKRPT